MTREKLNRLIAEALGWRRADNPVLFPNDGYPPGSETLVPYPDFLAELSQPQPEPTVHGLTARLEKAIKEMSE